MSKYFNKASCSPINFCYSSTGANISEGFELQFPSLLNENSVLPLINTSNVASLFWPYMLLSFVWNKIPSFSHCMDGFSSAVFSVSLRWGYSLFHLRGIMSWPCQACYFGIDHYFQRGRDFIAPYDLSLRHKCPV